jgi:sugar lactone lactonase YvrE
MASRIWLLALLILASSCGKGLDIDPSGHDDFVDYLYVALGESSAEFQAYRVDSYNGSLGYIGTYGSPSSKQGAVSFASDSGANYLAVNYNLAGTDGVEMWRIDPSTGTPSFEGQVTGIGQIAQSVFNPNLPGMLYAFAYKGTPTFMNAVGSLVYSGTTFTAGSLQTGTANSNLQSMAFSPSGTFIYASDASELMSFPVSPATGVISAKSQIIATQINSVIVHPSSSFAYAIANSPGNLYSLAVTNSTSGAASVTNMGSMHTTGRALALDRPGDFLASVGLDSGGSSKMNIYSVNKTSGSVTAVSGSIQLPGTAAAEAVVFNSTGYYIYVTDSSNKRLHGYFFDRMGIVNILQGFPINVSATSNPKGLKIVRVPR